MTTTLFLSALLRTTLFLSVGGVVCSLVLRRIGNHAPQLSRMLWLAVLLSGWFWVRPMISISYESKAKDAKPVVTAHDETLTQPHMLNMLPVRHEMFEQNHVPTMQNAQNIVQGEAAIVETFAETAAHENIEKIDWKPWILSTVFAVWISGMVVSIFLAAAGYIKFLLALGKTVPADASFAGPWRQLLKQHGIDSRTIPMLVSECDASLGPALIRTVHGYRLVVPRELWSELSEAGRCGILKHELAHFQRLDVWKSFFVRVLALPHWFNPIAHLAVHRFEEAAEQLCDRAAFDLQQEGALEFARTLLLLHENAPTQFVARQSIFGRGLKHRVACLLHENPTRKVSLMKKAFLLFGAVTLLAVCLFRFEFVEKTVALAVTNDNPMAKNVATETNSEEMVELRLTVVDEEKNPVPHAKVELYYGSESQYAHSFEAGSDGIAVTKIPVVAANPETQGAVRGTEKGMANAMSLWEIPRDWNPSKPLELTITIYKRTRCFTGTVVDADGKPVAGALVGSSFNRPLLCALTNEKGRFEHYDFENPVESLFAFKDGVGGVAICPDYDDPSEKWKAMNPEGREEWKQREKHNNGPFTLKLSKGDPISIRVVDYEGNPVEGVLVAPTSFSTDYRYTKETRSWNAWGLSTFLGKKTDADGMARFDSVPTEDYDMVCFNAFGDDPRIVKDRRTNQFGKGDAVWRKRANNNDLVISLPRQIMIEGSVKNADGTPPSEDMQISITGSDWASVGTHTDYAGNFSFFVKANEVISVQPIWNTHRNPNAKVAKAQLNVPVGSGRVPAPRFDFVLEEGARVYGKIIKGNGKLDSKKTHVQVFDMAYDRKDGDLNMSRLFVVFELNEQGEFEIRLPDGRYRFTVNESIDGEYVEKEIDTPLEINGESEVRFDLEI